MTNSIALVPVFSGTINSQSVQLCDARALHAFMAVLRDFSNWIKGRIRKFGFVNGVDFISISRSPELASGNRGASIDYHLTLDMAKELSMVENNEKGREARRYFMECEKQVLAALSDKFTLPSTITTAQCQHLQELVDLIVASGRQKTHGETWARFHRKMHVNKYSLLHPDQFDAACNYLRGKLDDASIATLIQKHLPNAVPAITSKNALQALPAPDNALTKEQADTLRDMMIYGAKTMPRDLQGLVMREGCLKLKSHFKVDYCEIPQDQFAEAVALVARHITEWDVLDAPKKFHFPLEAADPHDRKFGNAWLTPRVLLDPKNRALELELVEQLEKDGRDVAGLKVRILALRGAAGYCEEMRGVMTAVRERLSPLSEKLATGACELGQNVVFNGVTKPAVQLNAMCLASH